MKTNLILTGWFYPEYMAAAAAVQRHYSGDADIFATSMAGLASSLRERGLAYRRIDILGVGLTENLDDLAQVVKDLVQKKVRVNWYSKLEMSAEASAAFTAAGAAFSKVGVLRRDSLVEVVGEFFDGVGDEDVRWLREIATADGLTVEEYAEGKRKVGGRTRPVEGREIWPLLYKAAGFAHRDHQDEEACACVVNALLELHDKRKDIADLLPPALKKLMSDYQAGGEREFIGKSAQMKDLRRRLAMAAGCADANVLILGETGAGKDLAAEYVHANSARRGKRYEHYNCAYASNDDMMMDELFGHVKGAFTGAVADKEGLFARADGGTLFLDEIATASKTVQSALLLVLENGRYTPLGSSVERQADVRLVCATNEDLQQMVLDGSFRHDLYQRICQFPVAIPPLREHMEDLEAIANVYWRRMTGRVLTKRQVAALKGYDYSGNVRELVSILKQAKTLEEEDFSRILDEHIRFNGKLIDGLRAQRNGQMAAVSDGGVPDAWREGDGPNDRIDRLHHAWAVKIYGECSQNLKQATEKSGVSRNTFKKYLDMTP